MNKGFRIAGFLMVLVASLAGAWRARAGETVELTRALGVLSREAGVELILDRRVTGRVPAALPVGDARRVLLDLARRSGHLALLVDPPGRLPVIVVAPGPATLPRPRPRVEPAAPEGTSEVAVESMVLWVTPHVLDDLRSHGTVPRSPEGSPAPYPSYMEGVGPGMRALLFAPADTLLGRALPWGVTGDKEDLHYEVRARDRFRTVSGQSVLLPLDRSWLHAHDVTGDVETAGLFKEALEVIPERTPDGKFLLTIRVDRSLSIPGGVDPSPQRSGRARIFALVEDGGDVLIWGLGLRKALAARGPRDRGHDPLERRTLRRAGTGRGHRDVEALPMERVVRIQVRSARGD